MDCGDKVLDCLDIFAKLSSIIIKLDVRRKESECQVDVHSTQWNHLPRLSS